MDEFKDLKGEPDWQTVFAIKKEITDDLLDRLPPVRDVSLVYRLTAKLLEALSGTDGIADVYYDNASALANQTVLKIKFSLNFLNEIDYAFYSEIRETLEEAPTAQQGAVESLILLILNTTSSSRITKNWSTISNPPLPRSRRINSACGASFATRDIENLTVSNSSSTRTFISILCKCLKSSVRRRLITSWQVKAN